MSGDDLYEKLEMYIQLLYNCIGKFDVYGDNV